MSSKTLELPWQIFHHEVARLSECPLWDAARNALWWVDIPGQLLCFQTLDQTDSWQKPLPSQPGALALDQQGDLLIAMRSGLFRFAPATQTLHSLCPAPYDTSSQRFNDGRPDAQGRFIVGCLHDSRQPLASLYSFDGTTPTAQVLAEQVATGNGVNFSPDQRTLYWADTAAHSIFAFDYEPSSGQASNRRLFWQSPNPPARPDGCAVDVEGCLWVALFEGQSLIRLSPKAELLATIPTPMTCPTMPAFGGSDMRTLFLSSAGLRQPEQERARFPLSGKLLYTQAPVAGLPIPTCQHWPGQFSQSL